MKTRAFLSALVALTACACGSSAPERTDPTRPQLPYNPALYNHEGRMKSWHGTEPAWTRVPFAAEGGAFRVSRVAEGGKVETRERLLSLFAEIAKGHSYDVATNRAVARDTKAEAAGALRVLDQEAFVEALKGGQTFAVTLIEPRRCPACHGEGVLRPRTELGENRDLPRKDWKKCPWGEGAEADFAVSYTVSW